MRTLYAKGWVSVVSVFLVASAGAASARTGGSCPFEEDSSSIKTVPYQELYGWVDSIPKLKEEFEKTAAFERRRQDALTRVREILKLKTGSDWIIARKRIAEAHYDADREAVLITTEDRYSAHVTTDYIYDIVVLDDFIANHKAFGLEVGNYTTDLGQYDAQNAFGVHVRTTKQLTFRDTVAFGGQDNMAVPHFPPILAIRVPPSKAKELMGKLEVAVAGKLLPPFAKRVQDVTEASIDHPYEDQTITKIVFIKPACVVIRTSATGEIYARAR